MSLVLYHMRQPTVTALKPLIYQGRSYVRGDRFLVVPAEGLAMARRGEVTLTKGVVLLTRDVEAETPTDTLQDSPTQKRRYRRRDMTAEQA